MVAWVVAVLCLGVPPAHAAPVDLTGLVQVDVSDGTGFDLVAAPGAVAANQDTYVYSVWPDARNLFADLATGLFFNRSDQHGRPGTWLTAPIKLATDSTEENLPPALTTDGDQAVYVAWTQTFSPPQGISFRRSLDHGQTWSDPRNLTTDQAQVFLAADRAGHVYAAWAASGLWVAVSTNQGGTWSAPQRVDGGALPSGGRLEISTDVTGHVYVAWRSASETLVTVSDDYGVSWLPRPNAFPGAGNPRVAQDDSGHVYLVWGEDMQFSTSASFGRPGTWSAPQSLGRTLRDYRLAAAATGHVYVVWPNAGIQLRRSVNFGASWEPLRRISSDVAVDPGVHPTSCLQLGTDAHGGVYVAYDDRRDATADVASRSVYTTTSNDFGAAFGPDVRLDRDDIPSSHGPPLIGSRLSVEHLLAVNGTGYFHVAWEEDISGGGGEAIDIYTNGGRITYPPRVVFVSQRDGNAELYSVLTTGEGATRLTQHPDGLSRPVASPDGQWIAFVSNRNNPYCSWNGGPGDGRCGHTDLYRVRNDGTGLEQLTDMTRDTRWQLSEGSPAWSPDGTKLAFEGSPIVGSMSNTEIFVMDLASRVAVNITNHPDWDGQPNWNPDTRQNRLAFASDRSRNGGVSRQRDVFVVSDDGTNLRQLTDDPAADQYPVWSPIGGNGQWVAFISNRDAGRTTPYSRWPIYEDRHMVYLVRTLAMNVGLTRIPNSQHQGAVAPAWHPWGWPQLQNPIELGLAFTVTAPTSDDIMLQGLPTGFSGPGGGPPLPPAVPAANDPILHETYPVWSPDGLQLAYQTQPPPLAFSREDDPAPPREVYLRTFTGFATGGGAAVNLTHHPADDSGPAWIAAP